MMTGKRALELLAELSLIDINRLLLMKAASSDEGLSNLCAREMRSESTLHTIVIRCKKPPKKAKAAKAAKAPSPVEPSG